ncbi:MAG TPA: hypothetical protein VGJ81_08510 [Thermoanaerobaculia bacterium]|jgi:hypothetical protein
MAEETLVKEALTDEMIEAGKTVVENLDRRRFLIDAALWFYLTDQNQWRLLLASPEVHLEGPRKAYKRLLEALRNAAVHGVSLQDVAVIDTRDPLIQMLRVALRTDRPVNGIRFSRNTVNGQFIEDAYIYRMAA